MPSRSAFPARLRLGLDELFHEIVCFGGTSWAKAWGHRGGHRMLFDAPHGPAAVKAQASLTLVCSTEAESSRPLFQLPTSGWTIVHPDTQDRGTTHLALLGGFAAVRPALLVDLVDRVEHEQLLHVGVPVEEGLLETRSVLPIDRRGGGAAGLLGLNDELRFGELGDKPCDRLLDRGSRPPPRTEAAAISSTISLTSRPLSSAPQIAAPVPRMLK